MGRDKRFYCKKKRKGALLNKIGYKKPTAFKVKSTLLLKLTKWLKPVICVA